MDASRARVIMLADLDYFYAQVEERKNPSLIGKPVVVCVYSGRTEDSGVVATANYAARKYGVKSGIPITLAKKRLLGIEAVFIAMNHDFYKEVSDRVMAILRDNADNFEQVGIDEAYLDVSQRTDFSGAEKLAMKIKDDVKKKEGLTISIGVGTNKVLAKIASDMKKPDGLTIVRPGESKEFLAPLLVDKLLGVGVKTVERMESLGIKTIGDLASYDQGKLAEVFGKNLATYFHCASNGIYEEVVQERGERESISRIATLKEDTRDLKAILEKTDKLCEEVNARVQQSGLTYRSVGIVVVTKSLGIRMRTKSLSGPTNDVMLMKKVVKELLQKYLEESSIEVRRIGVHVSNFTKKEKEQSQLTSFL